jgi:hypothetical protein
MVLRIHRRVAAGALLMLASAAGLAQAQPGGAHPAPGASADGGRGRAARTTSPSSEAGAPRVRRWYRAEHASRRAARLRRRPLGEAAIRPARYEEVRSAAQEVLSRFPPDRYFYVGIGRSPSALVELLRAVVPDQTQSFPASGLSGRNRRGPIPPEPVDE